MARRNDLTGTTLSHYRILEPVGAGGMGEVYRARDTRLERDVAVKVLPSGALSDEASRRRFRKEALALSKLNHPNIGTIHDFDSQDGIDFLVMELIPGVTLDEPIARGPMPEREAARIGEQVAEGLAAAHDQRVVHRDIKPSNIRVTPEGRVKILDFGLARRSPEQAGIATTTETAAGEGVAGTLPYMSPEQLRGEPLDGRTDLYSLGAVLYESVTGRRAFPDRSAPRLIGSILSDAPLRPRSLRGGISAELERIVLKCLEKDAANRYQSARELAVDLRGVANPAGRTPDRQRPHRVVRAPLTPWIAGGLAAALALAALVLDPGGFRERLFGAAVPSSIPSLAVLPLANLTGDASEEYFADGLTEELITRLSRTRALKVISRTSVMQYKGARKTLPQIGRELGVRMLLEGAVQRSGDRVRVTAKLMDAASERNLWADTFEQTLSNVFAIESEIARAIVAQVEVQPTPQERARIVDSAAVDPETHALYLKGRYYLFRYGTADMALALDYFGKALERDPTYAAAYASMAESYSFQSSITIPARQAMPLARANAEKALELDPSLGDARTVLGCVTAFYDWNWRRAGAEFRQAVELYPGSARTHHNYGYYLVVNGRFQEAQAELNRAHELDPLSGYAAFATLWPLYNGRRYDDAIRTASELLRARPGEPFFYHIMGQAYLQKGDYPRALREFRNAVQHGTGMPQLRAWLGYALALAGQKAQADSILRETLDLSRTGFMPAYYVALLYAGRGDREKAFEWLGRGVEDRSEDMVFLKVEPAWDALRPDPRFKQILRRVGFEP